jgi:hypothetical protein
MTIPSIIIHSFHINCLAPDGQSPAHCHVEVANGFDQEGQEAKAVYHQSSSRQGRWLRRQSYQNLYPITPDEKTEGQADIVLGCITASLDQGGSMAAFFTKQLISMN